MPFIAGCLCYQTKPGNLVHQKKGRILGIVAVDSRDIVKMGASRPCRGLDSQEALVDQMTL